MDPVHLANQAHALFEEGYTRTDYDCPGVLRWWSARDQESHPPKTVPLEVWFYIHGIMYGIGYAAEKPASPTSEEQTREQKLFTALEAAWYAMAKFAPAECAREIRNARDMLGYPPRPEPTTPA